MRNITESNEMRRERERDTVRAAKEFRQQNLFTFFQ